MFLAEIPDLFGTGVANAATQWLVNNPATIAIGIGLIVVTILVIVLFKQIIVNSVLGIIALAVLTLVFQVQLPFVPAIIASIVFGLAGIGAMLLLKFFGVF